MDNRQAYLYIVRKSGAGSLTLSIFAVLFVALVGFLVSVGKLSLLVLDLYLAVSIITFAVYALDKSASKSDRWRTRERTLHLFGLLGGWPGALIAQRLLRHKSKKQSFQVLFWTTAVLNCLALALFLR